MAFFILEAVVTEGKSREVSPEGVSRRSDTTKPTNTPLYPVCTKRGNATVVRRPAGAEPPEFTKKTSQQIHTKHSNRMLPYRTTKNSPSVDMRMLSYGTQQPTHSLVMENNNFLQEKKTPPTR